MTFWIYNLGMGVPLSEKRIYNLDKPTSVEELAKLAAAHQITDKHESTELIDKTKQGTKNAEPSVFEQEELVQKKLKQKKHNKAIDEYQSEKNENHIRGEQIKFVDSIMTSPVISLSQNLSLAETWTALKQHKFRHFTVVNESQKLVGMISDKDILHYASSKNFNIKMHETQVTVNEIMSPQVLTVSKNTLIREACKVMVDHHIGALPVTDQSGLILGILTRHDVLKAMIKSKPLELWF